ncbi:peptide chain release factor 1 [Desulfonatronum lacustre]|uniref:peptide chain release factor 1 n=1 Tax=Desulfonatronum lacustre TaxID=66849 RepID=UPI00049171D3|nr:peptide chain release factor 1 [Desulfonatronum lacustre]SMP73122.1 peptide chain release factor 1 [Desulfonatronum zhilinae]
MFAKLESLQEKYQELERELSSAEVFTDQERYRQLTKRHAELGEIVSVYREFTRLSADAHSNKELFSDSDPEIREMARAEATQLEEQLETLRLRLQILLLPKDPLDDRNVILEIRAGTGGEEAALFASDLFRMYMRYAERVGLRTELIQASESGTGGFKEVIAAISGDKVYSRLKHESGVHRVQRVPATESQGRIHTSAVTVAILPEAEEVDVHIDPSDVRVDVYRSSGPGGQSVNTTDSAVRVTHIPTGLVVICQDEKSQHKNRAKAMKVLRSRLLKAKQDEQKASYDQNRKNQVGSGDRSERIRTYNFPQGRITDHRINLTLYRLESVLEGEMDELVNALVQHYQTEALKAESDDGY